MSEAEGDWTNRKEGDGETVEAETAVMWTQVKECQKPVGAGRGSISPGAFRERMALPTP